MPYGPQSSGAGCPHRSFWARWFLGVQWVSSSQMADAEWRRWHGDDLPPGLTEPNARRTSASDVKWWQIYWRSKMEQLHLTLIIQWRLLILFGYLVRMDESADSRRILTAVPRSDWKRPAGRPCTSWLATMKNDLLSHNFGVEDATELALDRPL